MSCQQVPRLTEDPYTFTETVPATATIFNPQTHRLAPIISSNSNNLSQKQLLSQKLSTPLHTRVIQQTISSQVQQNANVRINGLPHKIVNGFHKPAAVSNTTNAKAQQPQIQYQSQTKQVVAGNNGNVITKKFLQPAPPPPVPSLNALSYQHQSHPLYSVAKPQNSIVSTSPPASSSSPSSVPLPPLFQKSRPLGAQTLSTISSTPKQQILTNQTVVEQNVPQRNHSNVNTSRLTPIQVRGPTQGSSTVTTLTNYGVHTQFPAPSLSPVNVIRKVQQPSIAPRTPQSNTSADAKQISDSTKRKPTDSSDQSVFVTPAKRDSRPTTSVGKKGIRMQSSSSIRAKRSYSQTSHHEALQRISAAAAATEWHAPDSYIFDNTLSPLDPSPDKKEENYDLAPCVQNHWLDVSEMMSSLPMYAHITREQRIELRKAQLRRQALQYISAQKFHTTFAARKRLQCVAKALRKLRERDEAPPPKKCCFPSCINDALAMTAYCYLHITRNSDQYLFFPCTAKFSDNSQCRVPVFDISHELPLCREHAWKRDNYNRIIQEQKPKKPPRKRPKPSAMTRPIKRNKKKRKSSISSDGVVTTMSTGTTLPSVITKTGYQLTSEEISNIISRATPTSITTFNTHQQIHQDMLSICENSSAYESSEDTGVGGLSESELMVGTNEIAEEIPLGDTRLLEEHDLTNVLNQLPVDAFNELFTTVQQNGPLEPTQEEQEDLERALEAVNKQVKSLQQLTGGDAAFLGDFLDVDDQILDEADIAEVVLHSPNSSSIETDDTGNIIITSACNSATATDIRGLVQT